MKYVSSTFLVIVISLTIAPILNASAAYRYVSTSGNDSRKNGTAESPWRTLQYAARKAQSGDIILVAEGNYEPFHITESGVKDAPIVFKADGKNVNIIGARLFDERYVAVSILASYITIDGFNIDVEASSDSRRSRGIRVSGIYRDPVHGVIIRNNTVKNAGWVGITTSYAEDVIIEYNNVSESKGQHGIYVANSADRPRIRGNVSHHNRQAGIQINADIELAGDHIIEQAVIENNILYENGSSGSAALNLASIRNSLIRNNLLYNNRSQGIASWDDGAGNEWGSKNNMYLNNTVVMPIGSYHAMSFRHGSTGNVVKNNILLHLGNADSIAIDSSSISGFDSDYNIISYYFENTSGSLVNLVSWRNLYSLDKHSKQIAKPKTVLKHISDNNYKPAADSPAVDAGIALPEVLIDIISTIRPQGNAYDIGAYELKKKGLR